MSESRLLPAPQDGEAALRAEDDPGRQRNWCWHGREYVDYSCPDVVPAATLPDYGGLV